MCNTNDIKENILSSTVTITIYFMFKCKSFLGVFICFL